MSQQGTPTNQAFHPGEEALQERLGVREKMAELGRRVVRPQMPDQHQAFFQQLPYLFYGALDDGGTPWASMLIGSPGFVSSPDSQTLRIDGLPLTGDPLWNSLRIDHSIGLLGLDLATRRRNRANGSLSEATPKGIRVDVHQSFGNCPKYIQTRTLKQADRATNHPSVTTHTRMTTAQRELISTADTFFIATHFSEGSGVANEGADVSHRGGRPGFVTIEKDSVLTFPDFAGNRFFNTLGNLQLNPRCGLTFIDFERGDLLFTTGTAETLWDGDRLEAFNGAERLISYEIAQIVHAEGVLPYRFSAGELSPFLEHTGAHPSLRDQGDAL